MITELDESIALAELGDGIYNDFGGDYAFILGGEELFEFFLGDRVVEVAHVNCELVF